MADSDNGHTSPSDAPDGPRSDPGAFNDSQSLARIATALEAIVALMEQRSEADQATTMLAQMLTGDMPGPNEAPDAGLMDEPPIAYLDDDELIQAHYRNRDGTYGIHQWTTPYGYLDRKATPDEAARLDRLVGRRRK